MNLSEKYWYTILITFCRYLSIIMMGGCVAFIPLGYYINQWFYLGLVVWPLFIMWGIVNMAYLKAITRVNKLQLHKIMEKQR